MTDYAESALVRSLGYLAETQAAIAHNLANVDSSGFKRRSPLALQESEQFRSLLDAELPTISYTDVIDWSSGSVRPTGDRLHVTLGENEFFRVKDGGGRTYYTRDGELKLDPTGRVVTASGLRYLDPTGSELLIGGGERALADLKITANGTLLQGNAGNALGALGVFTVTNKAALQPTGDGTYADTADQSPTAVTSTEIRQGFLERSNVESLNELVAMIGVQRSFQATQRTLSSLTRMQQTYVNSMSR